MQPKYEEKTFESYFNTELDRRTSIYFPFGQVQEGGIGADAAAMSQDHWLWHTLGFPYRHPLRFPGVDLREVANEMETLLQHKIRNIPAIKANLLFQYKRPEVITTANGAEWSHWKQRYFRYTIYKEQQVLLEHLERKFGVRALILYASPALVDIDDLVNAKLNGNLIEATNFCRSAHLQKHHRNTYIRAGNYSIACSEPEKLPLLDLISTLEQLEHRQSESNIELVLTFASLVRNIAADDPYLGKSFRSLIRPFQEIGLEKFRLLFAHVIMNVFRELTGTQWLLPIGEK
ncbi:hypothetical protein [Aeromonas sp. sia0103]|uniref:hypothetical protein n=1 Tax=Aeromonas sp. sia0103 TaxID=2854782 RepID=UPI001C46DC79|nr:hypothetical protein [Aeromonas sp. sia0103]MBV7597078.1 hypothetical protein [Aeromonas sp. sia0103]